MRSRPKAHINTEIIIKLLQGKQEKRLVQWLCNTVQLAFCSSERNLVALGISGKLISRAHVLRPVSGRQGLCDSAWTPTWVFVCLRVCTCVHWLFKATRSRRAWLTAEGSGEARGNKCALVQTELTRLRLQLCFLETTPSWFANNQQAIRLKTDKNIYVRQHCLYLVVLMHVRTNPRLWGNSRYCLQIPEKM